MKFLKPKNDWAKALFILNDCYLGGVSMAKVLTNYDSTFYKFQTRLGDVIKEHPKLKVSKVTIPYKSKLDGKQKHYMQYTPICHKKYLYNLYNLINEKGLSK